MIRALIHICSFVTLFFYLLAALSFARWIFGAGRDRQPRGAAYLRAGVCAHLGLVGCTAYEELSAGGMLYFAAPETLSVTSALLVILFLAIQSRSKLNSLGIVVAPLAIVFLITSGILFHLPSGASAGEALSTLVAIHVIATIISHVLLALAFAVSILLIVQERYLKEKRAADVQRKLPAVLVLDRLNGTLIRFGFVSMLIGIVLGLGAMSRMGIAITVRDARLFSSLVTLGVYAALLTGMYVRGLRGQRAAWLSIVGFLTVILSFGVVRAFGSSFHAF